MDNFSVTLPFYCWKKRLYSNSRGCHVIWSTYSGARVQRLLLSRVVQRLKLRSSLPWYENLAASLGAAGPRRPWRSLWTSSRLCTRLCTPTPKQRCNFQLTSTVSADLVRSELSQTWEAKSKSVHKFAQQIRAWRRCPQQQLRFSRVSQLSQYGRVVRDISLSFTPVGLGGLIAAGGQLIATFTRPKKAKGSEQEGRNDPLILGKSRLLKYCTPED